MQVNAFAPEGLRVCRFYIFMHCGYEYWNTEKWLLGMFQNNREAAHYRANGWSLTSNSQSPNQHLSWCNIPVISDQSPKVEKNCLVVISKDDRLQIFAYIGGFYASYRILKLLVSSPYLCFHLSGEELAHRGLSQYLTTVTQRLALAFANWLYPQELYINSTLYTNITVGRLIIHAFWFVTTTERHIPPRSPTFYK